MQKEDQPGEVVYVIGAPGSKTVKIGRTTNPSKRQADIQRMSPVPLKVLWTHPGGCELETNLHRQFSALRTHGEWFTFGSDPVASVQWAIKDEPWLREKISLKKTPRPVRTTPLPDLGRNASRTSMQIVGMWTGLNSAFCSVADIEDPVERYEAMQLLEDQLADERLEIYRGIANDLKNAGNTWEQVGELLGGLNAEAAHQISLGQACADVAPRPKLPHDHFWKLEGFPG